MLHCSTTDALILNNCIDSILQTKRMGMFGANHCTICCAPHSFDHKQWTKCKLMWKGDEAGRKQKQSQIKHPVRWVGFINPNTEL